MKFTVDQTHLTFFAQNGAIAFEELLPEDSVKQLLNLTQNDTRDQWRKNETIKTLISSRSLVEIASQLSEIKPLRLGYDQTLFKVEKGAYADLFEGKASLNDISCFQGIAIGLLLSLNPEVNGKGLFLNPAKKVLVKGMIEEPFMIITYTILRAQYIINRRDPHSPTMMRLGYTVGDRLDEALNPTVYR